MEERICYDDCMKVGWKTYNLEDVCEILDNLRKPINSKDRQKRIEGKKESELYPYYGATGQVGFIDDYLTDGEFVLIGEDGAPYFDFSKNISYLIKGKTWVNNHAHVLKSYYNNNYLMYYLNQLNFKGYVSGTTRLKLTQGSMRKIPIEIAPLPEQRAIVSKIEQLFSELDNGISNLKLAQEQLKVYRQAVLKKAFEGELTKKWREQQTDLPDAKDLLEQIRKEREEAAKDSSKRTKKKILQPSESIYEDNIPKKWCWVKVDSILFDSKKGMTTGPFGTALKKHEHQKSGIPVYGIENIGEGVFRMPNKIFITEEKAKELQAFEVKPYDIIISRSGTVGEICSIPENVIGGIISTNLIRVRLNINIISTKYFVYLFQGGNVREQVKELCKGSTREFLNQTILSSINFPLCSLPEQQAIVQEIETRLLVCDKIEQEIETNLEKAEALRQSILKKAFEGKLLNEKELAEIRGAEDWEPAEVLLEKIKAERAKNRKK